MAFRLKITSPYGTFYDQDVQTINVKTVDGYIGVLENHIPLVSPLEISIMMIRTSEGERHVTLAGGIIYVKKKETVIVTPSVEFVEDIDVTRANEAYQRAKQRLDNKEAYVNVKRAELALSRSLNRIHAYDLFGK
jgi:F-type H+-transporting ATPase subunit epsilon